MYLSQETTRVPFIKSKLKGSRNNNIFVPTTEGPKNVESRLWPTVVIVNLSIKNNFIRIQPIVEDG